MAHVMRADLAEARKAWIQAAQTPSERTKRESSAFQTRKTVWPISTPYGIRSLAT